MDTPVVKIMTIAASVAMAVVLIAVGWNILGNQTPDTEAGVDFSQVTDQTLCEALSGTWTSGACNAPVTTTTAAVTTTT